MGSRGYAWLHIVGDRDRRDLAFGKHRRFAHSLCPAAPLNTCAHQACLRRARRKRAVESLSDLSRFRELANF